MKTFLNFLHKLEDSSNEKLIESIRKGYNIIFEYESKSAVAMQDLKSDLGDNYKRLSRKYKRKHGEDRIKYANRLRKKWNQEKELKTAV